MKIYSKMNVGLLKMTYALNFVQSTTTYQEYNLKELYVNLKVKEIILIIMKFVTRQS